MKRFETDQLNFRQERAGTELEELKVLKSDAGAGAGAKDM